jgi:hypothetical protein
LDITVATKNFFAKKIEFLKVSGFIFTLQLKTVDLFLDSIKNEIWNDGKSHGKSHVETMMLKVRQSAAESGIKYHGPTN